MKAKVDIEGSACGFTTTAIATSDDGMYVAFDIKSHCDKVKILAAMMTRPIEVRREIDRKQEGEILRLVRAHLLGECNGCPVPSGLFKAMQVAVGLAQEQEIRIRIEKEPKS